MAKNKKILLQSLQASHQQKGATLFVAMIFLLVFGAMAAASLSGSLGSNKAIANIQWRNESIAVANSVIAKILSGTKFSTDTTYGASLNSAPGTNIALFDLDGDGALDPLSFDMNGDGVSDVRVTMPSIMFDGVAKIGPRCIKFSSVPISALSTANADDLGCYGSGQSDGSGYATETPPGSGVYTSFVGSTSICANTDWIIPVRATDAVTKTTVDVMQGASVRVFISDAKNSCQ